MSTVNSQQKIDGFNAIASNLTLFMVNLSELSTKIKNAADIIAVPAISQTATGLLNVIKSANNLCEEVTDEMKKIATTWAERSGFGETARAAFEDCAATVAKVATNQFTVPAVEPCDGLHENVTDETVSAFKKEIEELADTRYNFIMQISTVRDEFATEDTMEVYNNIGAGVETFTNGIVAVLDEHKAELQKFGVALDESIAKVKSQSSNITSAGEAAKVKIQNFEADLD